MNWKKTITTVLKLLFSGIPQTCVGEPVCGVFFRSDLNFFNTGFSAPSAAQPPSSTGLNVDFDSVFGNKSAAHNTDSAGKREVNPVAVTHSLLFFTHDASHPSHC